MTNADERNMTEKLLDNVLKLAFEEEAETASDGEEEKAVLPAALDRRIRRRIRLHTAAELLRKHARGIAAAFVLALAVDADGLHVKAYGQSVTVPYEFANGVLTANISAIYPDYSFATASLAGNGELIVTLADATGYVGETLYLKPEN